MEKRIIVFEGGFDSLISFADQMAEAFEKMGYQILRVDQNQKKDLEDQIRDFSVPGDTVALFFNHVGMNLLTEQGDILWNELEVDCYDYIVDHPMYYHEVMIYPIKKLTILCVDENHKKYLDRFYKGNVKSFFLPLAGTYAKKQCIPFEQRSMDLVFTGAYLVDNNIDLHLAGLEKGVAEIWKACYIALQENRELTLEDALERILIEKGIQLEETDLRDTIRLFKDMDGMLRSQMRAEVVRALANAGVRVHLFGEGWEFLDCKQNNLVIHERVSFEESIDLMADAKIVLNVMPWFKSGVHDRVYTAMLNQCVCLTDSSKYMDRTLHDGENVSFFSISKLDELPDKVKNLLSSLDLMKKISEQGYLYAKDIHTWENRAKELSDIFEHRNSIKIYTMTHKKFFEPEDPIYIPLHVGRACADDLGYLGDNTGDNISDQNKYFGELTGVYWVWKNDQNSNYIGVCHYRRFFMGQDGRLLKEEDYEKVLKDYDVIVSQGMMADGSYADYYGQAHNKEDLLEVGRAIEKLYPEDYPFFEQVINQSKYYYGNLMVTSRALFCDYAEWLFSIFKEVQKHIDVSAYDLYNQRIYGFLSEQLLLVWITKKKLKPYECRVGITAEKAETVELKLAMKQLVKMGEIGQAREMFYAFLKLRPDVQLELSDVKKELPLIEQILYIMQEEEKQGIVGLKQLSNDLDTLIEHFKTVYQQLQKISDSPIEEAKEYWNKTNLSAIMVTILLLNADFSMEEKRSALRNTKEYFLQTGKTQEANMLEGVSL